MKLIDGSGVNGLMKLWIYQFYLLAKLSWPFLIQQLDMSFVKDLERSIMTKLKKWARVGRTTEVGVLFRSKAHFGLGLTSLTMHYRLMQVVNCQLLKDSADEDIVALFAEKTKKEGEFVRVWRSSQLSAQADAEVKLVRRFPSQQGRRGLGAGNFVAEPSPALRRKLVSQVVRSFEEEKAMSHVVSLAQQSVWTQWADTALPFDLSWRNLLHGPGPHVIGFVLNASLNWVKTPDLLKTWGYKSNAKCVLCQAEQCTLHHMLSGCSTALRQKRYTWRHDSVLAHIEAVLRPHVENTEGKEERLPPISKSFVKAGEVRSTTTRRRRKNLLDGAKDWKMEVDYDNNHYVFPPEIYSTNERPDIVIWSAVLRKVILIELTCPAEEGILPAQARKEAKYNDDLVPGISGQEWTSILMTIEVGARGYVAKSVRRCLYNLGVPRRDTQRLIHTLSRVVAKCSYTILQSHEIANWESGRPLLRPEPTEVHEHAA